MQKHKMLFFEGDSGGGSGGAGGSGGGTGNETLIGAAGGQGGAGGGQGGGSGEAPKFLVGEDGNFADNWTSKLPEELGDYRNGLAKFKTVADFAKSYQGLEQKLGSNAKMVAIPDDKSKPEEVAEYRKAMGIPEKPEDYKLMPEKFPEGVTPWPKELIAPFETIAHKFNVPPAAMKAFMEENIRQHVMSTAAQGEMIQASLAKGREELQKKFGDKFEPTVKGATAAVTWAGEDPQSHGFADPAVVRTIAFLRAKISEDTLVRAGAGGETGTTNTGPALAKQITTDKTHPDHAKYHEGDPDVVAKVRRLYQQA
jgi:hypothetical protein